MLEDNDLDFTTQESVSSPVYKTEEQSSKDKQEKKINGLDFDFTKPVVLGDPSIVFSSPFSTTEETIKKPTKSNVNNKIGNNSVETKKPIATSLLNKPQTPLDQIKSIGAVQSKNDPSVYDIPVFDSQEDVKPYFAGSGVRKQGLSFDTKNNSVYIPSLSSWINQDDRGNTWIVNNKTGEKIKPLKNIDLSSVDPVEWNYYNFLKIKPKDEKPKRELGKQYASLYEYTKLGNPRGLELDPENIEPPKGGVFGSTGFDPVQYLRQAGEGLAGAMSGVFGTAESITDRLLNKPVLAAMYYTVPGFREDVDKLGGVDKVLEMQKKLPLSGPTDYSSIELSNFFGKYKDEYAKASQYLAAQAPVGYEGGSVGMVSGAAGFVAPSIFMNPLAQLVYFGSAMGHGSKITAEEDLKVSLRNKGMKDGTPEFEIEMNKTSNQFKIAGAEGLGYLMGVFPMAFVKGMPLSSPTLWNQVAKSGSLKSGIKILMPGLLDNIPTAVASGSFLGGMRVVQNLYTKGLINENKPIMEGVADDFLIGAVFSFLNARGLDANSKLFGTQVESIFGEARKNPIDFANNNPEIVAEAIALQKETLALTDKMGQSLAARAIKEGVTTKEQLAEWLNTKEPDFTTGKNLEAVLDNFYGQMGELARRGEKPPVTSGTRTRLATEEGIVDTSTGLRTLGLTEKEIGKGKEKLKDDGLYDVDKAIEKQRTLNVDNSPVIGSTRTAIPIVPDFGPVSETGVRTIKPMETIPLEQVSTWRGRPSQEGASSARVNGNFALVSSSGKKISDGNYNYIGDFSDGLALFWKYPKFGFLNSKGEEVIPAKYDMAGEFKDGYATVKVEDKWGYIDSKGKVVVGIGNINPKDADSTFNSIKKSLVSEKNRLETSKTAADNIIKNWNDIQSKLEKSLPKTEEAKDLKQQQKTIEKQLDQLLKKNKFNRTEEGQTLSSILEQYKKDVKEARASGRVMMGVDISPEFMLAARLAAKAIREGVRSADEFVDWSKNNLSKEDFDRLGVDRLSSSFTPVMSVMNISSRSKDETVDPAVARTVDRALPNEPVETRSQIAVAESLPSKVMQKIKSGGKFVFGFVAGAEQNLPKEFKEMTQEVKGQILAFQNSFVVSFKSIDTWLSKQPDKDEAIRQIGGVMMPTDPSFGGVPKAEVLNRLLENPNIKEQIEKITPELRKRHEAARLELALEQANYEKLMAELDNKSIKRNALEDFELSRKIQKSIELIQGATERINNSDPSRIVELIGKINQKEDLVNNLDRLSELSQPLRDTLTKERNIIIEQISNDALAKLPNTKESGYLRDNVQRLRDKTVELQLMELSYVPMTKDQAVTVRNNLGEYQNRSYRMYTDSKNWNSDKPEYIKAKQELTDYLLDNQELKDQFTKPDSKGNKIFDKEGFTKEVYEIIRLLEKNEDYLLGTSPTGGVSAGRGVLLKKGNLSPAVRKFLGEYTDLGNITKLTTEKLTKLVFESYRDTQLAKVLLDSGLATADITKADKMTRLVPEGSVSREPLADLFVEKEVVDALRSLLEFDISRNIYTKTVGTFKGFKTVFSPMSWLIQWPGNLAVYTSGGGSWNPKILATNINQGRKLYKALYKKKLVDTETQAKVEEALKYNIFTKGLVESEVMVGVKKSSSDNNFLTNIESNPQKIVNGTSSRYSIADNIVRYVTFQSEISRVSKMFPEMSREQVLSEAAKRTRATYPNYDYVPTRAKTLSTYGALPLFVSFKLEIVRTLMNNVALGKKDFAEGRKNGNTVQRNDGAWRLASAALMLSLPSILTQSYNNLASGMTEDEQKAANAMLPEWDRDKTNLFTKWDPVTKQFEYVNMNYLIPTEDISNILFFMDDPKKAKVAVRDYFVSEYGGFINKAVIEVIVNKNLSYGGDISEQGKAGELGSYFAEQVLQPGIIKTAQELYGIATGKENKFTGKTETLTRFGTRALGVRIKDVNPTKTMSYQLSQESKDMRSVVDDYIDQTRKDLSREELLSKRETLGAEYQEKIKNIQPYIQKLRVLGKSDEEILTLIKKNNVSKEMALSMVTGVKFPFYPVTTEVDSKIKQSLPDTLNALRQMKNNKDPKNIEIFQKLFDKSAPYFLIKNLQKPFEEKEELYTKTIEEIMKRKDINDADKKSAYEKMNGLIESNHNEILNIYNKIMEASEDPEKLKLIQSVVVKDLALKLEKLGQ